MVVSAIASLALIGSLIAPGTGGPLLRPPASSPEVTAAKVAWTLAPSATAGTRVVVEEVAVAVAAVTGGEVAEVPDAAGSGEPDLAVAADTVVAEVVVTDVVESEGFQLVGITWPESADIADLGAQVRTRSSGEWSDWYDLEPDGEGPDIGTPDANSAVRAGSEPVWVGAADAVQARFAATSDGGPEGLALALVDPARPHEAAETGPRLSDEGPGPLDELVPDDEPGHAAEAHEQHDHDHDVPPAVETPGVPADGSPDVESPGAPDDVETSETTDTIVQPASLIRAATARAVTTTALGTGLVPAIAARPTIVSRAAWGADESLRTINNGCGTPSYASTLVGAAIHHTVTSNGYTTAAQAQAAIRSIYAYHVRSRGWCDIGYNFLVDKWGNIYEGRAGGVDRAVIGVHAGGFNTSTVGISMLGDFTSVSPTAAMRESVARIAAWRLGAYHRDPTGTMSYHTFGGENSRIPANTTVTLPVIFPHRQVAFTACPGDLGNTILSALRSRVRQLIGTNLVNPKLTAAEVEAGTGVQLWGGAWGNVDWRATMTNQSTGANVWTTSGRITGSGTIHASWSGRNASRTAYPTGTYTFTLTATDRATGGALPPFTTTLRVIPAASPFGQIDSVRGEAGFVRATGWAIDPNTSGPIIVQMYVDGRQNSMVWANRSRPDVGAAFPSAGPNHGYDISMPAPAGARTVCLYAINTGPGSSVSLGCRNVAVAASSPFGRVDSVSATSGRVRATGWAVDADTSGPIIVQMYVDGRQNTTVWANRHRPDVATVYPWAGQNRGFDISMNAPRGTRQVCVYGINVGPGSSVSLGCRSVVVP